eukprot:UN28277
MGLEYAAKASCFVLKKFFQRCLQNFLWDSLTFSRYLKGLPNIDLCFSKKVVTGQYDNQIVCQKK